MLNSAARRAITLSLTLTLYLTSPASLAGEVRFRVRVRDRVVFEAVSACEWSRIVSNERSRSGFGKQNNATAVSREEHCDNSRDVNRLLSATARHERVQFNSPSHTI